MAIIDEESIFANANISLINTRQARYNSVKFQGEVIDGKYVLTSELGKLAIDIRDEIILFIIAKFRFCPAWLAKSWYESYSGGNTIIDSDQTVSKLRSFIDYGLIYEFPSAVAVFLMPTERLAKLFGVKLGAFNNPPYNTLTHTISEEQVMFDCLSGQASYLKDRKCIPYVSSLGLGTIGSMCIPELDYSIRNTYFNKHIEEFNDQEARLAQEIIDGKIITTPDFKEFKLTIHKKIDQYDYELKIPDLAVIAPRVIEDGLAIPESVALEVELSNKGTEKYVTILDIYWANLKFGKVVYLTNDPKIKDNLIEAWRIVNAKHDVDGETRTCQFCIEEFEVPYNKEQLITV